MAPTTIQRDYLIFIHNTLIENSRSPTLRDLAARFNVSIGTVQTHLDFMKTKGLLDWEKGRPATLRVLMTGKELKSLIPEDYHGGSSRVPYESVGEPLLNTPNTLLKDMDAILRSAVTEIIENVDPIKQAVPPHCRYCLMEVEDGRPQHTPSCSFMILYHYSRGT